MSRKSGVFSALAKRKRVLGQDPSLVLDHNPSPRVNDENTVKNIRHFLKRRFQLVVGVILLSTGAAYGSGAYVACQIPLGCKSLRLLVSQTGTNYPTTNIFVVLSSDILVTNLITNLVASSTNYVAGQVTSTNGIFSNVSTNIQILTPGDPSNILIVPVSLIVPLGTPIEISRDLVSWRERITVIDAPVVSTNSPSSLGPASVSSSSTNGQMIRVTYRLLPDLPSLFFRPQPAFINPPIP